MARGDLAEADKRVLANGFVALGRSTAYTGAKFHSLMWKRFQLLEPGAMAAIHRAFAAEVAHLEDALDAHRRSVAKHGPIKPGQAPLQLSEPAPASR